MKTKTDFQAVKETYLEQVKNQEPQQIDERALTAKQMNKRADTLSKKITEFENMLKQSRPKGASKDYDKAIKEYRDAYLDLMDAVDKVEGMMK